MNKKKHLGQFFTTNVDYILQGFEDIIIDKNIVDPYAGGGDLLRWAKKYKATNTIGYDIDPNCIIGNIYINDSLISIPQGGDFILTNPPYLGKNKMEKSMKIQYMVEPYIEDLYHVSLLQIINSNYSEGIIIIPVNFFSAENSDKIRNKFLSIYEIRRINYFTEQVFDDTTYNVVAFHFYKNPSEKQTLNFTSFPGGNIYKFDVEKKYNYRIGGNDLEKILNCKQILKIKRLTEDMMIESAGQYQIDGYYNDYDTIKTYTINSNLKNKIDNNIIAINCIDSKLDNKICALDIRFKTSKNCLVGKNSSRNIAYILIDNCSLEKQYIIIKEFNKILNDLRIKYNSLFLTNFRDNNRKRVSFDFCYKLINYCYTNISK